MKGTTFFSLRNMNFERKRIILEGKSWKNYQRFSDNYENRDYVNVGPVCVELWVGTWLKKYYSNFLYLPDLFCWKYHTRWCCHRNPIFQHAWFQSHMSIYIFHRDVFLNLNKQVSNWLNIWIFTSKMFDDASASSIGA